MEKFSNNKIIKGNFSGIKKNLDSFKSYIIFENNFKKGDNPFKNLQDKIFPWEQVIDEDISKLYFVIQVDPGKENNVLGKAMGYGLSEDTVYYIFKAEME
jgi:hypothetical protein